MCSQSFYNADVTWLWLLNIRRNNRYIVFIQIYRWRTELRTAAAGFTAVVVAPGPRERSTLAVPTLEIELGRDIRVRIPATAPKELASAILKALVTR
jgi:hypothetical protein